MKRRAVCFSGEQEKLIDVETELEELLESEQRWAAKHKKTIEQVGRHLQAERRRWTGSSTGPAPILSAVFQTEQLQLKLIQAKDLNDQLEMDKTFMERQVTFNLSPHVIFKY